MFYFFSKTIYYFITPAGWLFCTLLAAYFLKDARLRRRFTGISLMLFWLAGNGFLTNELLKGWEIGPQPVPQKTDGIRVGVVLTGGMINGLADVKPVRPVLGHEADRVGQALWLYKNGYIQKILISGGQGNLLFQTPAINDEGQMVAAFLQTAGVPASDIVLERNSKNTRENAAFSQPILARQFNTNRCVLITSAWHMRRAMACFAKEGMIVTPFPTGFLAEKTSHSLGNYLLPNEKSFNDTFWVLREVVGYLTYWVVGYL